MQNLIANLHDFCAENNISAKFDEPMKNHTSFGIGGNADIFIAPNDFETLKLVINFCRENGINRTIVGAGSNLLVSDDGIEGAVISTKNLTEISVSGDEITAFSGAKLNDIAKFACKNNLAGFEFTYGIPGTLGGAVFMNAGAYGGEMKDVLISATHIDENGDLGDFNLEELDLGYRKSAYSLRNFAIISAKIKLNHGKSAEIKAKMDEILAKRIDKQPYDKKSAGSVFKRPEGHFAGTLIEQAGLKGFAIGGAQVSEKHAGFIVNIGGATCKNVEDLISHIQKTVHEKFGAELECEVKKIGR